MADNDREFKVRITGDASSLVAASRQSGDSLDDLSGKTKKYVERLKDSERNASDSEVSHRNLRFALSRIGPEAAEAGHMLVSGLANPATAALFGLAFMLNKVLEHHAELKKALEAEIDYQSILKTTAALGSAGMLKALIDGGTAAEEFFDKLTRLATAQETLKDKTDDAVEATKKESEALNKNLGEVEKAELAKIEATRKLGLIDANEAARQSQALKDRIADEKTANAEIAEQDVIKARKAERDKAQKTITAGPDIVTGPQIEESRAKGELESAQEKLQQFNKFITDQSKYIKDFGARLPVDKWREANMKLTNAQTEVANLEQDIVPQAQAKLNAARAERKAAEKRVEDAQNLKKALDREIPKLEADYARDVDSHRAEAVSRRQVSTYQEAAREAGTPMGKVATQDVRAAIATALAFEGHRPVSHEALHQMRDVASASAGQTVSLQEAVAMMDRAAKSQEAFVTQVMRLVNAMGALASGHSSLNGRVDSIEQQINSMRLNNPTRNLPGSG
jgi:hypothetical protein